MGLRRIIKQYYCVHYVKIFDEPIPTVGERKKGVLHPAHCEHCGKALLA